MCTMETEKKSTNGKKAIAPALAAAGIAAAAEVKEQQVPDQRAPRLFGAGHATR